MIWTHLYTILGSLHQVLHITDIHTTHKLQSNRDNSPLVTHTTLLFKKSEFYNKGNQGKYVILYINYSFPHNYRYQSMISTCSLLDTFSSLGGQRRDIY